MKAVEMARAPEDIGEPNITINGNSLTDAQAMTLRVALEVFNETLRDGLGDDRHGKRMTQAYRERIDEIRILILRR